MHNTHAIIVTGASSGIGHSLALHLARQNHLVIATGRRENRINALSTASKNIIPVVSDVTSHAGQQKIIDAVKDVNKPVHIIHNAAIASPAIIVGMEESLLRNTLETNLIAPVLLTKALVPYFKKSRLLNISSGLAHEALLGTSAYCMSKAALFMFYKCLNMEFTPEVLIAGSVDPGIVDTEMQQELRNADKEKLPVKDMFVQFHKEKQLVSPDNVSQFILHILLETSDKEFSQKEWIQH